MAVTYVHAAVACRLLELREAGRLSYPGLAVGLALASFVDGQTGVTLVDQVTLGKRAGVCLRSVADAIRELAGLDVLAVEPRPGMSARLVLTPAKSCRGTPSDPCEKSQTTPANSCRTPLRIVADYSIEQDSSIAAVQPRRHSKPTEPRATKPTKRKPEPQTVPSELEGLELFATNERLCRDWSKLKTGWQSTCRDVDALAEVTKAHCWLLEHPERRKKNVGAFLGNWLRRAQERAAERRAAVAESQDYAPPPEVIDELERRAAEFEAAEKADSRPAGER